SELAKKMKHNDTEVASAAAVALGRIGGSKSAKALTAYLSKSPATTRTAVAEGCIPCAEGLLTQAKASDAVKVYDTEPKTDVPKQRLLEAPRGALLARQANGIPLLVEQLRSTDQAFFGIGLRTARELPGLEATKAVIAELHSTRADRQPLILLAVAD